MVASQRCLERARPTPFDAHQFEGRPPHKTQPRASAPPTAPKRASGLLDAGPLPHLEHHRRPHPRPLELGYIPTPLLTHQDNLGSSKNGLASATQQEARRNCNSPRRTFLPSFFRFIFQTIYSPLE